MSETRTKPRPTMAPPSASTAVMSPEEMRAIGKTVARGAGGTKVSAFFEANKSKLQDLLPQHMTPDRFLRVAMNALRTTPKLMDCTVESLFGATLFCAQIGLEPNTPQGHVYLIPFNNRRKETVEVQVIIGYQGMIELARRSGEIESLMARAVYEKDVFEVEFGLEDRIVHKPFLKGERGALIGTYAVAKFKDGGHAFDFMTRAEIEKIRDGSQGYQTAVRFKKTDTPWISHFDEMARKTAVRRLRKYLPMSIELAAAAQLDEAADRRVSQGMHRVLDHGEFDIGAIGQTEDEEDADQAPPPKTAEPPRASRKPKEEAQAAAAQQDETQHDAETGEIRDGEEEDHGPDDGDPGPQPDDQTAKAAGGKPAPELEFGA